MEKDIRSELGLIAGCWDLLHAGHLHAINTAQSLCKQLIIAFHIDPSIERNNKNKPIQTVFERFYQLDSMIRDDDYIIPYESELDLENILKMYNIDIRFLGEDYEDKEFTGKLYCEENKIELFFIPRRHTYSTSELRKRIEDANNNRSATEGIGKYIKEHFK